jgi:threonine dehydratase
MERRTVEEAQRRIADAVTRTPLQPSAALSAQYGRPVLLKREDLQPVRSYKLRGALNMIRSLPGSSHVVCASAGNHGQGVAWACRELGVHGTVVLPVTTPRQKRDRLAHIGGDWVTIVTHGRFYDDAAAEAARLAAEHGYLLVPPFDAAEVVAGQGTVGLELLEQAVELGLGAATISAPVGGGGLLAGLATSLCGSSHHLVGVEPSGAASMRSALDAGHPVRLQTVDTFVDGAAVAQAGTLTHQLVSDHKHGHTGICHSDTHVELLTAAEGAVASAMLELYQRDGIIAEPAGALSVAAIGEITGTGPVICVLSGGNNDVSRYAEVLERSLVHRGLRHYFLVQFPQVPGALRRFLDEALGANDDIVLFEYVKKSNREAGPALVGIELADAADLTGLVGRMDAAGLVHEKIEPGSALQRFLV